MFIRRANRIIGYTVGFLIACLAEANAQSWDVHVNAGYASYSHRELRAFQDYLLKELSVEGEATDKFPPYFIYSLGVNRNSSHWDLGLELGHGSTGGRIYYEDYSGKLIAEQLVNYNYLALTPSVVLHRNDKLSVHAGLKLLMVLHKLIVRNTLTIGNETLREEMDFLSGNLGFQPHIRMRKYFTPKLFIQGSAGYEIQDNKEAIATDDNAAFLADENSEPVHLQGSGVRLAMGIGFAF